MQNHFSSFPRCISHDIEHSVNPRTVDRQSTPGRDVFWIPYPSLEEHRKVQLFQVFVRRA